MTLETVIQIFDIANLTVDFNLKKLYKNLIFLYHHDAHPNENPEYFKAKIQEITEAYSILEHNISILKNDSIKSQNEMYYLRYIPKLMIQKK